MIKATEAHGRFGSVTADTMVVSTTDAGAFGAPELRPVDSLDLHPATHALHYGSSCFEGLKAHLGADGTVRLFRAADHAARLRASAAALCLPVPDHSLVLDMIRSSVRANIDQIPAAPGALYLRPVLLGTDSNIGAAAVPSSEAMLYVVASPVGSYFAGDRPLTVAIETDLPRSTPHFGAVKTGANYAMALATVERARAAGADQVLFAPGDEVQETGASNVMVFSDNSLLAPPPDPSILAGVTCDSVMALARDLGYEVDQRPITVNELLELIPTGEVALSGTAAVLCGVGTLVHRGRGLRVGDGEVGPGTVRLRDALMAVQQGTAEDRWRWTEEIERA